MATRSAGCGSLLKPGALLLAALVALALAVPAGAGGAGSAQPSDLDARLQAVVDGLATDVYVGAGLDGSRQPFYVPGAALSVSVPEQRTRTYAAGWANLRRRIPMRADQVQPIGSGTKPMTAALIIRLVTRGRVRLRDRLIGAATAHRRDGGRLARLVRRFHPRLRGVTIRELLAMTSGLRDFDDDPTYVSRFARSPRRPRSLRQLAGLGLARPRLYPPGAPGHTYYSNTNYALLGMLVEAITGRPYAVELRRMLRGAGIRHTTYPGLRSPARVGGPLVHGYAPPLRAGGSKLLRSDRRAFARAPRVKRRVRPDVVQQVASDPLAEGPTVEVAHAPASLQARYGGPAEVRREDLTSAFSLRGSAGTAGAIVSNTEV